VSYLDTTTKLQDRILDLVAGSQDRVLGVVQTVVDKAEPVTSKLPRLPVPERIPAAGVLIDNSVDFAERYLASQKTFAHKLVDLFAKPSRVPAQSKKPTAAKVA
jgi:hypothetical protein